MHSKLFFILIMLVENSPFPLPLFFSNWTPWKGYYKKGFLPFVRLQNVFHFGSRDILVEQSEVAGVAFWTGEGQ